MDQITHKVRLANWKNVIEKCQARPEGANRETMAHGTRHL